MSSQTSTWGRPACRCWTNVLEPRTAQRTGREQVKWAPVKEGPQGHWLCPAQRQHQASEWHIDTGEQFPRLPSGMSLTGLSPGWALSSVPWPGLVSTSAAQIAGA